MVLRVLSVVRWARAWEWVGRPHVGSTRCPDSRGVSRASRVNGCGAGGARFGSGLASFRNAGSARCPDSGGVYRTSRNALRCCCLPTSCQSAHRFAPGTCRRGGGRMGRIPRNSIPTRKTPGGFPWATSIRSSFRCFRAGLDALQNGFRGSRRPKLGPRYVKCWAAQGPMST